MNITLFGSDRQQSIRNHYAVTDIQDNLTHPHNTKEIIQAITYCMGTHSRDLQRQFENTDLFVVEITSRILTQTDDEIEADILTIKDLLYPKKLLIVQQRSSCDRELDKLCERLCVKHSIPFLNPSEGGSEKACIDALFQKKTLLFVWKQEYAGLPRSKELNFWGIGDMLRGAIGVFHLAKKYNLDLIIDKTFHPISKLLKQDKHRYTEELYRIRDSIPTFMTAPDEAEYHICNFANSSSQLLCFYSNMTHASYDKDITPELRRFMEHTLRPTDEFEAYLDAHLPKHAYSILHYRLGDDELVRSGSSPVDRAFIHLLTQYGETDIVISDSNTFKQYIRKYCASVRMFDTQVCHIGHEESYDAIRDTLFG